MKKLSLQGTITAMITPFKKDGSIDFPGFEKLIDFQINNNADGILVCGSTGESATLTYKERQAIIIKAVEYTAGRIPVIAGTGTNETQTSHDLTLFAKEHGADAALLVTPYYIKPTQQGLYEHFHLIADRVDIPIILYNVPGRTAVNMRSVTQLKLAEHHKNIIATKEASGDMDQMMEIIKYAPGGFSLFSGDDSLAVPVIAVGGVGVISVLSNYATKEFAECINLALKGKFKEAMKIHFKLMELMELNFVESNPIPVKSAMSLMNLTREVYRLPLIPIKPVNKRKIKKALLDAGLIKK